MAMVRNSVGSDAYVADEIITSRAGVSVQLCMPLIGQMYQP